jgi:agmatinase
MKIKVNPSLELINPVDGQVRNLSTGQVFSVSSEALSLMSLFCEPRELQEDFSGLSEFIEVDDLPKLTLFMKALIKDSILVLADSVEAGKLSCLKISDKALVEKPYTSCLSAPIVSLDTDYPYEMAILGIPFDLGSTGYPGSRFGPSRLRELSANSMDYRAKFDDLSCVGWYSERGEKLCEGKKIVDVGDVIHQAGEPFHRFFSRVEKTADKISRFGAIPISIGGDHSCLYPLVRSAVKRSKEGLHVIIFDAHTDLAEYDKAISHNHGNVVSRLMYENVVSNVTHVGLRGMVGKPLVKSGYRDLYAIDDEECLIRALTSNESADVYVSFDVDAIDPSLAPGTGTPVPMGLNPATVLKCIHRIGATKNVLGFDIVEYNPMRDVGDMTGNLLLHLLPRILHSIQIKPSR